MPLPRRANGGQGLLRLLDSKLAHPHYRIHHQAADEATHVREAIFRRTGPQAAIGGSHLAHMEGFPQALEIRL